MNRGLFDPPEERRASPSRLRLAREAQGLTLRAVAELLDVSAASVTHYEAGKRSFEHHVPKLSSEWEFESEFFFGSDIEPVAPEAITFRSRHAMTARIRDRVQARSTIASRILSPALHSRFDLPPLEVPDLYGEDPETAARLVRDQWGLGSGPVVNMVHLLEAKGVEVYWLSEASRHVDALSYAAGDRQFVFLNVFKEAGERGRMDAAHELAHLVLHRGLRIDTDDVERQADRFASAFLLPREQYALEGPRSHLLSPYLPLKQRWGVSLQALVRRSYELRMISKEGYQAAYREMSRRGWRSGTPEPGQQEREVSGLHDRMFEVMKAAGTMPQDFARENAVRWGDLLELMPSAALHAKREIRLNHLRLEIP